MRIRALDVDGDWTYGKGQNNYLTKNAAIAESIQTRLLSFLGDCFFDMGAGIDWFNFLGGKDSVSLQLAIAAVIINTENVTGLRQLTANLSESTRNLTVSYQVQTTYSVLSSAFSFDLNGAG